MARTDVRGYELLLPQSIMRLFHEETVQKSDDDDDDDDDSLLPWKKNPLASSGVDENLTQSFATAEVGLRNTRPVSRSGGMIFTG
jgi:hypothetical protein